VCACVCEPGAPPSPKETKKAKPKKEARSWDGVGPRSKKEKEALDFSDKLGAEAKNAAMDARNAEVYGTGGAVSLDGDYFNEEVRGSVVSVPEGGYSR
jgi:hypothetical protein